MIFGINKNTRTKQPLRKCRTALLLSNGCRMEANTPLKICAMALWRSSSEQPEQQLNKETNDDSPLTKKTLLCSKAYYIKYLL
jgi:hypothetical protein